MFKKILLGVLLFFIISSSMVLNAFNLVPLRKADDSGNVVYRNTNFEVQVPDSYELSHDFRAVWISHFVSDFHKSHNAGFSNEADYKKDLEEVFEIMEFYNLNAMIFHIRTHNNAYYRSDINPVANYYRNVNFNVFDPLEYIIEECQKRGIEFHAWLNPYRLSTSWSHSVSDFAATQPSYNIASDPEMILKVGNSLILNPGEPAVREFIIDTVMEIIERYNVDAIHFDDYFYIQFVDDAVTRGKYNSDNLTIGDFRRLQVDIFIEDLSNSIRDFCKENNRVIQLGISPSGIYRNGAYVPLENYQYNDNGDLIYPLFSNSSGFAHYGDYLYSDTKKWIDNEWIDYIIPQIYWSFEQPVAPFADIMDWWAMAVKNKNVNLYSGMGLYMITGTNHPYSWRTNNQEALNQVLYGTKWSEVQGYCIFSFKHLRYAYEQTIDPLYHQNMTALKNQAWNTKSILPEIRTFDSITLPAVQMVNIDKTHDGFSFSFSKVHNAKQYIIYRSTSPLTFSPKEVIDILGVQNQDVITYDDVVEDGIYFYGVKVMSSTNTLSSGQTITSETLHTVDFVDHDDSLIKRVFVGENEDVVAPTSPSRVGYKFVGWDQDLTNVTSNMVIKALYSINQYSVAFMDGTHVIDIIVVNYNEAAVIDDPVKEGYYFVGWNRNLSNITSNLIVNAHFVRLQYTVTFIGSDNQVIKTENVLHGEDATPPTIDDPDFIRWDKDYTNISDNLEIRAVFIELYTITFKVGDQIVKVVEDASKPFTIPEIPEKVGYNQVAPYWSITDYINVSEDLIVEAIYSINIYKVTFIDKDGDVLKEEYVEHGKYATSPSTPTVSGYRFGRWDKFFDTITDDLEVQAIYVQTKQSSSCKGLNIQFSIFLLGIVSFVIFKRRKL